jgi:Ras-related protein Rab-7A
MQSFDNIESWITEFLNQGNPKDPENFPFVLIGNKVDREEDREVDDYLLRQFLLKYPKIKHLTTSAKDSLGVETAF